MKCNTNMEWPPHSFLLAYWFFINHLRPECLNWNQYFYMKAWWATIYTHQDSFLDILSILSGKVREWSRKGWSRNSKMGGKSKKQLYTFSSQEIWAATSNCLLFRTQLITTQHIWTNNKTKFFIHLTCMGLILSTNLVPFLPISLEIKRSM